jgi:hypothetical protein
VATDNFWGKFRHWRRRRPFWGGLLLLLSGLELFASGNMTIGGLEIHLGPTGFLSYLLPLILVASSLLVWFNPTQRLFYAIVALVAALYSFIGLNLGGFFIGMLLGLIGGGLVIAWGPPRPRPGTELSGPPTGEPGDHQEDGPVDVGDDIFNDHEPQDPPTERIEVAGHDDRPHQQQDEQPIRPAGLIAEPPRAERRRATGLQRLAGNPRARALAVIPVAVTAAIVVASSNLPASADETCPDGLPSISATATTAHAAAATKKKTTATRTAKPKTKAATSAKTTSAAPSASASATSAENPILGGIKGVIDGVGNLLGITDDSSASPSTSPSPSESTTKPAADPTTTAADPTTAPTATATSTGAADPTATTATASPTASGDVIPCLGNRIYGKVASADDIPVVAKKPGLMEVSSLTLYNSTYDGVVDMPTDGGGSYKALKFSMDKAVNKPFKLTIDEKAGHQTVITSKELTTTGTVKFYTTELKGKLFGLIPVTFTPDAPPPLTLPVLWFTDVTVQLAFVRCDTLTGDPLKIDG